MEWIFDPVPASGARTGGDPSAFVFAASTAAFVREVLQNSVDQARRESVKVGFVLDVVEGERLRRRRAALGWDALAGHVDAVVDAGGQTEHQRFARALSGASDRQLDLVIDERNTTGLVGPESGAGNYAALCRDRLFSEKPDARAGGSFGLGKAVLWRFSRWSTVVFYSRLSEARPEGLHRLVAKAALPWHKLDGREYMGDGWLGRPEKAKGQLRAVSVWDDEAAAVLPALGLRPLDRGSGTTIVVLGFEDPTAEGEPDPEALGRELQLAAEREFWPAMVRSRLTVSTRIGTAPIKIEVGSAPWQDMLYAYDARAEVEELTEPGQIVVRTIELALPPRAGKKGPQAARVDLVVRLSTPGEDDVFDLCSFRGAGMVVERTSQSRVASAVRPFHAIVVAGLARRDPDDADAILEDFLRDAEPPSHDRWTTTNQLRNRWGRGYKKALDELGARVRDALKRLVMPPQVAAREGPEGLRRLFPVPGGPGGPRDESPFRFEGLSAELGPSGRWAFRGRVAPRAPSGGPWSVRIDLRFAEDGGPGAGGLVAEVASDPGTSRVEDGVAVIEVPAGADSVAFQGTTEPGRYPIAAEHAELELVVRGAEGP